MNKNGEDRRDNCKTYFFLSRNKYISITAAGNASNSDKKYSTGIMSMVTSQGIILLH